MVESGKTFKARSKSTPKSGKKLPNLPALKATPKKKKGKGKLKRSGTRTIDYQDLGPGVRVAQTPGM